MPKARQQLVVRRYDYLQHMISCQCINVAMYTSVNSYRTSKVTVMFSYSFDVLKVSLGVNNETSNNLCSNIFLVTINL